MKPDVEQWKVQANDALARFARNKANIQQGIDSTRRNTKMGGLMWIFSKDRNAILMVPDAFLVPKNMYMWVPSLAQASGTARCEGDFLGDIQRCMRADWKRGNMTGVMIIVNKYDAKGTKADYWMKVRDLAHTCCICKKMFPVANDKEGTCQCCDRHFCSEHDKCHLRDGHEPTCLNYVILNWNATSLVEGKEENKAILDWLEGLFFLVVMGTDDKTGDIRDALQKQLKITGTESVTAAVDDYPVLNMDHIFQFIHKQMTLQRLRGILKMDVDMRMDIVKATHTLASGFSKAGIKNVQILTVEEMRRKLGEFDFAKLHEDMKGLDHLASCSPRPKPRVRKCAGCSLSGQGYKACSRCRRVFYCGADCQREHWDQHQSKCMSKRRTANFAIKEIKEVD
jgi:hypothetical protein